MVNAGPELAKEGPEAVPPQETAGCAATVGYAPTVGYAATVGASVGYAPRSNDVEDIGVGVGTVEGVGEGMIAGEGLSMEGVPFIQSVQVEGALITGTRLRT